VAIEIQSNLPLESESLRMVFTYSLITIINNRKSKLGLDSLKFSINDLIVLSHGHICFKNDWTVGYYQRM